MDKIDVEVAKPQPSLGITPSHKISITKGSSIFVYWYMKNKPEDRDFDKMKDNRLIKAMHSKGSDMKPADFISFSIGDSKDYHLTCVDSNQFIIKSLNSMVSNN